VQPIKVSNKGIHILADCWSGSVWLFTNENSLNNSEIIEPNAIDIKA
jgi:hypothetical protein